MSFNGRRKSIKKQSKINSGAGEHNFKKSKKIRIKQKLKVRIRDSLAKIKQEMDKNKDKIEMDLEKMGGDIEQKFFGCIVEEEIKPPYNTMNENEIFKIKEIAKTMIDKKKEINL